MRKSGFVCALIFFSLLLSQADAFKIEVEVVPVFEGITFYNVTEETPNHVQNTTYYWENTGSVSCMHQLRVDIYRQNESLDIIAGKVNSSSIENHQYLYNTVWSKKYPLVNGENDFVGLNWYPEFNVSTNYTIQPRIFGCTEYIELPAYDVRVNWSETEVEVLDTITIQLHSDEKILEINSQVELNKVLVIPVNKNVELRMPYITIDRVKAKKTVFIPFDYDEELREERELTLDIVAEDGKKIARKTVLFNAEKTAFEKIMLSIRRFFAKQSLAI